MKSADTDARTAQRIADTIKPLLAGKDPDVQGAVLAELLSVWLAGHYQGGPELIETMLDEHIKIVRKLTVLNIKLLKSQHDH